MAWHYAPSHQAASSAGGLGMWALDSPIPSAQRNASRPRDALNCWATTLVQDSAESRATRHLDSPTDGGLEYLIQATPSGHASAILFSSSTPFTSSSGTFAMDASDSSAKSWLDIAQTIDAQQDLLSRSQDEIVKPGKAIKDPICLFRQFVSVITLDALKDIQPQLEVS
jgi:hypothetical protein